MEKEKPAFKPVALGYYYLWHTLYIIALMIELAGMIGLVYLSVTKSFWFLLALPVWFLIMMEVSITCRYHEDEKTVKRHRY